MVRKKVPFKTNVDQSIVLDKAAQSRRTRLNARIQAAQPKPIRAQRVNPGWEKKQRIYWVLKWILFLPLSLYALSWFLLLLVDFFTT
jgi:hypothetical protein